jgi:hypothetical protein
MARIKDFFVRHKKNIFIKPFYLIGTAYMRYIRQKRPLVMDFGDAVFFYLPKNGCSSMKLGLQKELKRGQIKVLPLFSKYKNKFTFTVVRNPYDRAVSCYHSKVKRREELTPYEIENVGIAKKFKDIYVGMSFKEFVRAIAQIPDERADRHFKSQAWFLLNKNGRLRVDYVGRFEHFNEEYEKICKKLGVKRPHKLINVNPSKRKKNYQDYYDEETKKLIQKRYKKDFELFNYNF